MGSNMVSGMGRRLPSTCREINHSFTDFLNV
jgi:hypothetical protein